MDLKSFLTSFLSWYTVLPACLLCFAPMRNKLKYGIKGLAVRIAGLLILLLLAAAYAETRFSLTYNALLPMIAIATFATYHRCLTVPLCKSLSIYALVFALMGFFSNFANGFDAAIHPASTLDNFSLEAAIFQAVITTIGAAVLFFPLCRYGSRIVDHFDILRVWYITLPVSGIFLTFNLLIAPRKYETIHVNNMFRVFWIALCMFLVLLLLLCALSYFIVSGMMDAAETQERNRILEIQESHYLAQQRYMDETAKARHDFKHVIGTLDGLVDGGDLAAVRAYLDEYLAAQPKKDTAHFCSNTAVNALLNYYMHRAQTADTEIEWDISLPDTMPIPDIDLCGILGNILENAVLACAGVSGDRRYIDLTVRYEKNCLYIVATNSFNGKVRQKNGSYLSTRRHGVGIGLKSIMSTTEKYGGTASFSHEGTEFCSDVVIPL